MTTLSQYLRAERLDLSEPADFYLPGMDDWADLKSAKGRAALAARSHAPAETLYSVEEDEEVRN